MKQILASIIMTFLLVACAGSGANYDVLEQKEGVVLIFAEKKVGTEQASGMGTGFFIEENVILTNNHVVTDSTSIKVALNSQSEFYDAEVVKADNVSDMAVIRLKDPEKFKSENDYRVLKFAGKYELEVTEDVYAIGHPWGLSWSVSRGILSAIDRKMSDAPKVLLQVDSNVFQGNSGGPLLNNQGRVIGINSLMLANSGGSYGFALPVSMIERVMRDWVEYGEVRWSFLGIMFTGDTVKEVTAGAAADKAGMKPGDVILEFKTSEGTYNPDTKNLPVAMAHHDSGQPVFIKIKRGEELLEVKVDPDWKPSSEIQLSPADGQ
jgi:S1-C subfamily serine protease